MSGPGGSKWPQVVDMSKDDAKRLLRSTELSAYSALIAAFRAQGDLTTQKRKILQELQSLLG